MLCLTETIEKLCKDKVYKVEEKRKLERSLLKLGYCCHG